MLFLQVPLMGNEGFKGSVEVPQSHLMVSCLLSRNTCRNTGMGWAALGCSVVRTRGRAKGFICLCQQAVDMTRARVAGVE